MTSRIRSWSSTAASNNATPPFGAPEGGTLVNQLSDILRQIMAEVRSWWETAEWIDFGHAPTYSSATVFTVTGNQLSTYQVGRRVRAINTIGTTIYGTITAGSYSSVPTVTVGWDSGSLDNTVAEVAVGMNSVTNKSVAFSGVAGTVASGQLPALAVADVGDIKITARATAPSGWLLAAGQAVSRSTYSALFSAIGTAYGAGDSSTTFNLPDLRGRVIAGKDDMGGTAAGRLTAGNAGFNPLALGAAGGDERVQQHTHVQDAHSHNLPLTSTSAAQVGFGGGGLYVAAANSRVTDPATATNQNYGTGNSQNVQPTIVLNYIIKT